MNFSWRYSGRWALSIGAMLLAGLVFSGCGTTGEPAFTDVSGQPAPTGAASVHFRVGDQVSITFSGLVDAIPNHEERIKDDGTITLPLINAVEAAGKTPGDLQKEIHDLYVPRYYVRLTVTVKSPELVYYVGGEVKSSGRQQYLGYTTVTKAIQSAGYFTDFANPKKVILTRADGKTITVNCAKALQDPKLDLEIFPGDKITVPRSRF